MGQLLAIDRRCGAPCAFGGGTTENSFKSIYTAHCACASAPPKACFTGGGICINWKELNVYVGHDSELLEIHLQCAIFHNSP